MQLAQQYLWDGMKSQHHNQNIVGKQTADGLPYTHNSQLLFIHALNTASIERLKAGEYREF